MKIVKMIKALVARVSRKALALAIVAGLSVSSAFAEGSTATYDFTKVTTELESLKTALSGWIGNALPVILGILGAFLVFFLVRFAINLVKRFINSAKG